MRVFERPVGFVVEPGHGVGLRRGVVSFRQQSDCALATFTTPHRQAQGGDGANFAEVVAEFIGSEDCTSHFFRHVHDFAVAVFHFLKTEKPLVPASEAGRGHRLHVAVVGVHCHEVVATAEDRSGAETLRHGMREGSKRHCDSDRRQAAPFARCRCADGGSGDGESGADFVFSRKRNCSRTGGVVLFGCRHNLSCIGTQGAQGSSHTRRCRRGVV